MAMFSYCLGLRLDDNYNEYACKVRDRCDFYRYNRLSEFLSRPDEYQELDTYNNRICEYEKSCQKNKDSNLQEKSDCSDFPIFAR